MSLLFEINICNIFDIVDKILQKDLEKILKLTQNKIN